MESNWPMCSDLPVSNGNGRQNCLCETTPTYIAWARFIAKLWLLHRENIPFFSPPPRAWERGYRFSNLKVKIKNPALTFFWVHHILFVHVRFGLQIFFYLVISVCRVCWRSFTIPNGLIFTLLPMYSTTECRQLEETSKSRFYSHCLHSTYYTSQSTV